MKKAVKILKTTLKSISIFLLLVILLLLLSIPYGKHLEKDINPIGINFKKVVLKGVNILTMNNDSILYNKNLYIENEKIVNITSDTIIATKDFEQIEAKGKFVIPGLIDMHAHIFDRSDLPQYLSYGVTTVRNMMGFPMHLRWKEQLKNNTLPGSNLITATPTINSGDKAGPFHKTFESTNDAALIINEYVDQGYDFIKVYDDIDLLQLNAIEKAAQLKNIPIAGHPPKVSFEELLSSSLISIEHVEELRKFLDKENSIKSIKAITKQIKKSNKAITINLIAFYRVYKTAIEGQGYLDKLNQNSINPVISFIGNKQLGEYTQAGSKYKAFSKAKFNTLQKLAKTLSDEGVEILFGTDSGPNFITPGKAVFEEIELLSESGISSFQILKSATINAASILQRSDLGTIKIGNQSDLLILNKNPLEDLNTLKIPSIIITNSQYYTTKEIKELRSIGENKQSTYATIGLFLEHLFNK